MYRSKQEYDELDKLAIDLYLDYNFNGFPLDVNEVCRKLGVSLVPYSAFEEEKDLLLKRSRTGFINPPFGNRRATIFYNDDMEIMRSQGTIRQTIFHEIKHYVHEDYGEEDPDDDDLAEHFARFFACPTPYLVKHNITDISEIISKFGVSLPIAENVKKSVENRIKWYGTRIFDYEQPLIDLIDNA